MKKHHILFSIIIVVLLCIPAMLPLFHSGFFPIQDNEQVGRLYELDLDIHAGQFPPRLAQDLGYGYDYPLFNFYPSFVYYVAEIFHLIGFSFITSIKLMIGLGFILAAFFMFLFVRKYFGYIAGLLAAVAYTYAPYHSVDVYVRGALPEFWSFVFIPLVFWLFALLAKRLHILNAIFLGLCIAGFLLTHNLILLMSVPFLFLFFCFLLYQTKNRKQFFLLTVLSGIIGAGLTAYFWLPELMEKQYTMINLLTTELANYNLHFVYFPQFWDTFWGYAGSTLGIRDGLSFQLGRMHIFYLIISLFVSGLFFLTRRKETRILFLFWIFLAISLILQTYYSKLIWDTFSSALAYIQFPWRYLTFTAFFTAFLIASIVLLDIQRKIKIGLFCIVSLTLIWWTIGYFQPQSYFSSAKDSNYTSVNVIRWQTSNLSFEYVPNGIRTKKSALGNTVVDISHSQIAKSSYALVEGQPLIKVVDDRPQEKTLSIFASTPSVIQMNVFAFPGWQVFIDNRQVSYSTNNPLKLIRVSVPQGNHTITTIFTDTPVRQIGNIISTLTTLAVVGFAVFQFRLKLRTND